MVNDKDDWEDQPVDSQDDWEDQPVEPSWLSKQVSNIGDMVSPVLETAQDFSIGTAKGLTMGALDELGGLAGAGVETMMGGLGFGPDAVNADLEAQGFTVPKESFLQKYRGYQQASEKAQDESAERSPIADTLGQVAGGITSGTALGGVLGVGKAAQGAQTLSEIAKNSGKAKAAMELLKRGGTSYLKASPAIAVESALTSKENLIGEDANPMGVAADTAGGLAFGLPAIIGMEGISQAVMPSVKGKIGNVTKKIADAFTNEDNPRLRQIAKSYGDYGRDLGIHPRSHGQDIGGQKFAKNDFKAASNILNIVDTADSKLGKQVGDSIQTATTRGALIDISPDIQAAAKRVSDLSAQIPDLGSTRKSAAAFEKMLTGQPQLNPVEIKGLIDDLDAAIGTFKSATNKDAAAVGTLNELLKYRKSISETFKKAVPEYAEAAQRFESFRNVLEQLVSGSRSADITQTFYGNLRNQDQKVHDKLLDIIENVQKPTESAKSYRTAFTHFMDSLEGFEQKELSRTDKVIPSVESIRKFLLNASDDSALRGSVRATNDPRSVIPDFKEAIIGKAPTSGAYLAGKAMKSLQNISQKPIVRSASSITRAVLKAPAQTVSNLASKLETNGATKQLGRALRESIENGDSAKKNAALFTIMQNPNAKLFINAEDFPDTEEKE